MGLLAHTLDTRKWFNSLMQSTVVSAAITSKLAAMVIAHDLNLGGDDAKLSPSVDVFLDSVSDQVDEIATRLGVDADFVRLDTAVFNLSMILFD